MSSNSAKSSGLSVSVQKERMEEGRKKTTEEWGGAGQVGGEGQREQGSLTAGHSGQGDT